MRAPHPTRGGCHIPDKTTAGLVGGVKNGFWFGLGMWRGPKELAQTIVPGMKGREGKRGRGDGWGEREGANTWETTGRGVFLSPRDWQAKSRYAWSLKLKGDEDIPQSRQREGFAPYASASCPTFV